MTTFVILCNCFEDAQALAEVFISILAEEFYSNDEVSYSFNTTSNAVTIYEKSVLTLYLEKVLKTRYLFVDYHAERYLSDRNDCEFIWYDEFFDDCYDQKLCEYMDYAKYV